MWANRALEQQWIEDNKYKGAYTNNKGQTSAFTFQERERERESGVGAREPEDGLADWNVTHTHIYICYTPKTYLFGLARHIVKQCAGASEDQLL